MHSKILILGILVTFAVFGASVAGFAKSFNAFEAGTPGIGVNIWSKEDRIEANASGEWVIEKNGEDAYPEPRSKRPPPGSSNRYVNPHPELGCLYYDENDKRHWFPGCREL